MTFPRWFPNAGSSGGGGGGSPTGPAAGDLGGTYPSPDVVALQGNAVATDAPSGGDVLTWDAGTSEWKPAAPSGGGTINGTIAANEVAFGTGVDSIGGSAQLEWNPGTNTLTVADPAALPVLRVDAASQINGKVTVTGGTVSCFSIESSIDGEFVSVDPSLFTVTVKDALSPGDYYANISPSDVTVADNPAQTSGQVNGQGVQAFDAATSNFAALRVVAGVPTLLAQDTATTTDQPLDVVVGELRVNGAPGNSGDVLTSQGAGSPPVWQSPAQFPLMLPLTFAHATSTPEPFAAVYIRSAVTLGAGSEVLVHLPAAGRECEVRLVDLAGVPAASWQSGVAAGDEYQAVPVTGTPTLSVGWYNIDVASLSGGTVNVHGMHLTT